LGRKRNKGHPGKRVEDLLLGEGKGAVIIRNKNSKIRVNRGKIVSNGDGEKSLIVLRGNPRKRLSFGAGTMIKRWRTGAGLRGK